jgi:hypothetical protein
MTKHNYDQNKMPITFLKQNKTKQNKVFNEGHNHIWLMDKTTDDNTFRRGFK